MDKTGRKAKYNQYYFDIIDSPIKAYWLGFLWCDGSVNHYIQNKYERYITKLVISYNDHEHLEKLKECLQSFNSISIHQGSGYSSNSKFSCLSLGGKHLGKTLYHKYGLIPYRYDWTKVLLNTPLHFFRDLIRGILDADGNLYVTNRNDRPSQSFYVNFGGSEHILTFIGDLFVELGFINKMPQIERRHKDGDGAFRSLKIGGRIQVMKILDWLYRDAEIYLDRKYQIYLTMKERSDACVKK